MPTATRKRPAARKASKTVKKKVMKRTVAKRAAKPAKAKILGKVVHYYDKIGVAIVKLLQPVKVGDRITFKRADREHTQIIGSLQVDHVSIQKAKKGDIVGIRTSKEVHDRSLVIPA